MHQELDRLAAERERNRGVVWRADLRPVALPRSVAESKGLRRADDKILLPPSAGRWLMDQGAMKNGAMFFEVVCPALGTRTHAGLLEFTAEEGTVGLLVYLALLVALARYIRRLDAPYRDIYAGILLIYVTAGLANGLWADFTHRHVFILLLACIPLAPTMKQPAHTARIEP